ncbi:MAG TPA: FAD-binding oxidoreductase, partial [Candidatus Nanopelagicales bacterium]|nr:FAD-binding oxidoreductase [Candidatus Nanopelagicales bacterium]
MTIAETCWWLREALAHEEFRGEPTDPVRSDLTADVAIVGGGFTGLWTAWHLTRLDPGVDVVVLEQDECGFGPSGRNGGFLDGFSEYAPGLRERYGDDGARAVISAGDSAVAGVVGWLEEQGVDAWYRSAPSLGVASSPAQVGAWDALVEATRALGLGDRVSVLDRDAVARVCASPVFE